MNHSTAPTPNATEIGIATGVFDLDTLRAECHALGLPTDRPTLRRVRRAIDLHQHGAVKPFHNDGFDAFFVQSQTQAGKGYTVLPHSGCSCPDAKRLTDEFGDPNTYTAQWTRIKKSAVRCKHEMATMLYKAQQAAPPTPKRKDSLCIGIS